MVMDTGFAKEIGVRKARPGAAKPASVRPVTRVRATRGVHVTNFADIYGAAQSARVDIIKNGVEAAEVARLARTMGMTKERLLETLGLSAATINKKARARQKLAIEQGERVIGIAKLVGQVQAMVERSGDPTNFNAAHWVARWLEEPNPALGGRPPAEYMDTISGQELVSSLILKAETGAYA